jgi:hypothetical protein
MKKRSPSALEHAADRKTLLAGLPLVVLVYDVLGEVGVSVLMTIGVLAVVV